MLNAFVGISVKFIIGDNKFWIVILNFKRLPNSRSMVVSISSFNATCT